MKKIIVYISDTSVGVENLPADVEVEIRDYRKVGVGFGTMDQMVLDGRGEHYVEHRFGDSMADDSLYYRCRACNAGSLAPIGTDAIDLSYTGRYCNRCGGNTEETPGGTAPDREAP